MVMDMAAMAMVGTKLKERLVLLKALIVIVIIVNVKKDMFIVEDMEKVVMVSWMRLILLIQKILWQNIAIWIWYEVKNSKRTLICIH